MCCGAWPTRPLPTPCSLASWRRVPAPSGCGKKGCTINERVYHPQVWTLQQAHGVDLLIVALKYGALPGALDSIRTIVSEHTVVMSLMNGVDGEASSPHRSAQLMCCPRSSRWPPTAPGTVCGLTPETTIGIIYGS